MNLSILSNTVSGKASQPLKYGLTVDEQSKLSVLLIIVCNCLPAAVLLTYFIAVVASTLLVDVGLIGLGFIMSIPFFLFSTFMAVCTAVIIILTLSCFKRETIEYYMGMQSSDKC
ncbi:hypothetical protein FO519_000344 [Halicephalobus sp. NKZ332]|nr:hypothetical protein FO519_000344 [Halicephalobus sp. NKZ332]